MEVTKKTKTSTQTKSHEKKVKKATLAHGIGRRKSSVARVFLKRGSGNIVVNDKSHLQYFDTLVTRLDAAKPFSLIPAAAQYDAYVNVVGGGLNSQAGAIKLGISRALVNVDPALKPHLKEHKLMTVDSRLKERKKYGKRGARRSFQFVKR